jgi:hypothetical protein
MLPQQVALLASTNAIARGAGDATAWKAAVVANGGTVSDAQWALTAGLIGSLRTSGAWALIDDAWALVAENAVQALTSLKQRRLSTAVNSPTFAANAGYTFDGATNYIDTGFIIGTHGISTTSTLGHLSVYERTNVATTTSALGTSVSSIRQHMIRPRTGAANLTGSFNSNLASVAITDSRGLSYIDRTDSGGTANINFSKNGASLGAASSGASGSGAVSISLFIGGYNLGGVLTLPRACQVGFASIGAPLSAAQVAAQYSAVQSYMTAKGANV